MILDPLLQDPKQTKTEKSDYVPTDLEIAVRSQILKDFALGWVTMNTPRQEFNDLSTLQRDQVDFMAFNTYQPNNGMNNPGDTVNGWRSNAIKPIERNKVISMAGHMADRLGFLKMEASDDDNDPVFDASMVINSQMDWVRSHFYPEEWWLHAVMQSSVSPAAIVHQEYRNVYRKVKTKKVKDKWEYEDRLDESMSGFVATIVPTDQLFIDNIFEKDIQKQRFIIWRSVKSHSQLEAKYKGKKNWDKVKQGLQFLFSSPNNAFYFAYDPNLQGVLGEEVIYWTKDNGGSKVTMVNGIIIGEADEKNPREDGLYPFAKWYNSWIRDNFFYGKSTVFAVSHDANIINTLYPVLVDGAILDTMKPMGYVGKDVIGSDVIVPGMTTAMRDPASKLMPLLPSMQSGNLMQTIKQVEESIDETADTTLIPRGSPHITAYLTSALEQQQARALAPFVSELVGASLQLTRLVLGDILQYCTVGDIDKSQGAEPALKYKSFLTDIKDGKSKAKKRKIQYASLPDTMTEDEQLKESFDLLEEQGGMNSDIELVKADPKKIRELRYSFVIGDDVLRPKSESAKFQENLALVDKAIAMKTAGANIDLDEVAEKLLFATNPITARDPDAFISEPPPQPQPVPGQPPSSQMPSLTPAPALPGV